jgi:DNA-binding response OmpR family regulator
MTLPQPLAAHPNCYQDAHLMVDLERETAYLNGEPLRLTYKAYSLLAFLVRHPGQLVPRETLLRLVWGYGSEIHTRTLDVHVRRLRKSLGRYGTTYLETIFGIGYRFQPCLASPRHEASRVTTLGAVAEAHRPWKVPGSTAH